MTGLQSKLLYMSWGEEYLKKNAHLKVISKKKSILKKYTQLSAQEMNLLMNLTQIFQ